MRRCTVVEVTRIALALAVTAALLLPAAAAAKRTGLTVSAPAAPHAGRPWTLVVHVTLDGRPWSRPGWRPTLSLVRRGVVPVARFRGTPAGPGAYRVRVVFPSGGAWRYAIPDPLNGEWWFLAPRVAS
jgi:hypothetical protein